LSPVSSSPAVRDDLPDTRDTPNKSVIRGTGTPGPAANAVGDERSPRGAEWVKYPKTAGGQAYPRRHDQPETVVTIGRPATLSAA